jgi:hypothetical protein
MNQSMSQKAIAVRLLRPVLIVALAIGFTDAPHAQTVSAPAASAAATADPVFVRVGPQEVIRASDVKAYALRRTDLRALLNTPTGVAQLVKEIAMTRALVLEGERLGEPRAGDRPADIDPRFDDIYALAVYRKLAGDCPAPQGEAQARAYFDAHPEAFTLPPQARVERIVLPQSATLDKFPAMQWLGLQAQAVAKSGARFDALVRRAQEAAPDLRQGDLGWITLEGAEQEPLLGAIREAGPGGLVGPVIDGQYVYLLRVADFRPAQRLSWEAVKHQVPTRAVQYCRETARNRVQRELFDRFQIVIDSRAIEGSGPMQP